MFIYRQLRIRVYRTRRLVKNSRYCIPIKARGRLHSKKFKYSAGIKHLPSTIFTNLLIKHLAVETNKTFLVLRSETLWKEIFGEELWMKLESEGRIITKGHKGMSQAITPGNIKKYNGYDKLVNILKH